MKLVYDLGGRGREFTEWINTNFEYSSIRELFFTMGDNPEETEYFSFVELLDQYYYELEENEREDSN